MIVLSVCLCVILSAGELKSNELISLKPDVMIGPTSRKNWLTFGGASVPDTDSRSLFKFPHHCRRVDFRRFISISHKSRHNFYKTWRND